MRVVTPAMKLDVRIEEAEVRGADLVFKGIAGILPCETTMSAAEVRRLIRMTLRPAVLAWLLRPPRA